MTRVYFEEDLPPDDLMQEIAAKWRPMGKPFEIIMVTMDNQPSDYFRASLLFAAYLQTYKLKAAVSFRTATHFIQIGGDRQC